MSPRDAAQTVESTVTGASSIFDPLRSRLVQSLDAIERELWFTAILAMVLDIALTVRGLHLGLYEINPVARAALETADIFGLFGLKFGAIIVGLGCLPLLPNEYTAIVPLGLAIPSLTAVLINTAMILSVLV